MTNNYQSNLFQFSCILLTVLVVLSSMILYYSKLIAYIENTSWKVLAYGIYARVVDVSEIERVSAANE